MESPFVYEDDFSRPIADLEFVVLTKRLLVWCMVLIAVLPVDSACNLESSVYSLLLSLNSLGSHCRADILPSQAVASWSRCEQGILTFYDRPCALLIAVVLRATCNSNIHLRCHIILGSELLIIEIWWVVMPLNLIISHKLAWSGSFKRYWFTAFLCINYVKFLGFIRIQFDLRIWF